MFLQKSDLLDALQDQFDSQISLRPSVFNSNSDISSQRSREGNPEHFFQNGLTSLASNVFPASSGFLLTCNMSIVTFAVLPTTLTFLSQGTHKAGAYFAASFSSTPPNTPLVASGVTTSTGFYFYVGQFHNSSGNLRYVFVFPAGSNVVSSVAPNHIQDGMFTYCSSGVGAPSQINLCLSYTPRYGSVSSPSTIGVNLYNTRPYQDRSLNSFVHHTAVSAPNVLSFFTSFCPYALFSFAQVLNFSGYEILTQDAKSGVLPSVNVSLLP